MWHRLLFMCVSSFFLSFAIAQCPWISSPIFNTTAELRGLSLTFQSQAQMGQYANGDWWIVGPVSLIATFPPFDGQVHGFEINPSSKEFPGFDYRLDLVNLSLVPTLPVVVQPGSSIVKTESAYPIDDVSLRVVLNKAVVFTVVAAPPPGNGQYILRPNYFGVVKYDYDVRNIDYSMLPRIRPSSTLNSEPTLTEIMADFANLRLDHIEDFGVSAMHPIENMPFYGADLAINVNRAILRLLYDDVEATSEGKCAVYRFLQIGIDHLAAMRQAGLCFPSNGGILLGRKLPIIMAATMLRDSVAEAFVLNHTGWLRDCFHEDGAVTNSSLYGDNRDEESYWAMRDDSGGRTTYDPYNYIDGGFVPGQGYQGCCNEQNWKAEAVILNLVPRWRAVWNHEPFMDHVARFINFGAWSQPDPCAPVIGTCLGGTLDGMPCSQANPDCFDGQGECKSPPNDPNYKVLYGPDGNGSCIKDSDPTDGFGRYPWVHGRFANSGLYGDDYFNAIHDYYFNASYWVNFSSVASQPTSISNTIPAPASKAPSLVPMVPQMASSAPSTSITATPPQGFSSTDTPASHAKSIHLMNTLTMLSGALISIRFGIFIPFC